MKIFKDEKGFRWVNPYPKMIDNYFDQRQISEYSTNPQWAEFESTVTHHDCPELPNAKIGEVYEAELVWRAKIFGDTEWKIMPDNHEPINAMGVINEQIFRLIPEKQPSVEVKGETAEEAVYTDWLLRPTQSEFKNRHIAAFIRGYNKASQAQSSEIRELMEALESFVDAYYKGFTKDEYNELRINAEKILKSHGK